MGSPLAGGDRNTSVPSRAGTAHMGQDGRTMPAGRDKIMTGESDRARVQKLERALQREFSVICFAWDGTAVARRDADASAVRSRVERLTALGVDIAVVSSADVADVDAQLRARPGVEGRLFLHLSRGSEIYVVGPAGPRLLERREATSLEEEQLVATAEALRDRLDAAGLDVALVRRPPQPAVDRPGPRLARAAGHRGRGAPPAGRGAAARGRLRRRPDGVHGAGARDRPGGRPRRTRPSPATSGTSTSASPARATRCTR